MSISDAQFEAWLKAGRRDPIALVEIDYVVEVAGAPVTQTLYCATRSGYVSGASDTPASQPYSGTVNGIPEYARSLDTAKLGGRYSLSLGQLELANGAHDLDEVMAYAVDGSEVRVYYGDASWPKGDGTTYFRRMFTALNTAPIAQAPNIVMPLVDSSRLLNRSIGGAAIDGVEDNADRASAIILGACNNVKLNLKEAATNTYSYADGDASPTGGFIVYFVRDRGVDLAGGWTDNADGTVTLTTSPDGQVTADVFRPRDILNLDTYRASDFYQMLASEYGGLGTAGLYSGAHQSFVINDSQDYHLGRVISEPTNILDLLTEIAESSNSFFSVDNDGQFYFGRIFPPNPAGAMQMTLTDTDIGQDDPKITPLAPRYDRMLTVGNRNWLEQSDLAGSVTQALRDKYSSNGVPFKEAAPSGTTYSSNPALYHKTMGSSPELVTLISPDFDSAIMRTEMTTYCEVYRRKFMPWVQIITCTAGLRAYSLKLGDAVTLQTDQYGFDAGVSCQVIGHKLRLDDEAVELTLVRREPSGTDTFVGDGFLIQLVNSDYVLQLDSSRIKIAA